VRTLDRTSYGHFCASRLFGEEGLEGINDNHARCVISAHRFKQADNFIQSDTLMNDLARLETIRCAHREHGIEALSLHTERPVESKLIEQDHVNGEGYIAFLFAGGVTELYVSSQLPK
jgi:hypothetical protein